MSAEGSIVPGRHLRFKSFRCAGCGESCSNPERARVPGNSALGAMPRRRCSQEEAPLLVADRPCIVGGKSGKAEVLPLETVDARDCVAICAFEPWLNRVLTGQSRGECAEVVSRFVAEVYKELGCEVCSKTSDDDAGAGASWREGSGCDEAATGRAALGLDSDSDCEELAAAGSGSVTRQRSFGARAVPAAWATVRIRGQEITVRRRPRGRGVLLPVLGPDLPAALTLMRADLREGSGSEVSPTKRQRVDRAAVDLLPSDKGCVIWMAAQSSWQVVYRDEAGVTRRTRQHLAVPAVNAAGRRLSPEECEASRRSLLLCARRRWNELDRSSRPRFPSELCEAPETS